MKKITMSLLMLAFTLVTYSQKELKSTFGVMFRLNTSTFREGSTFATKDVTVNPEAGVSWKLPFSPGFGARIDGLYTTTGSRYGTFNALPRQYDLRLHYAKVPVALYFGRGDFTFNIGYYEAYLLDRVTIGSWNNTDHSFSSKEWIAKRSDRGIVAGWNIYLNPLIWTTQATYGMRGIGTYGEGTPLYHQNNTSISSGLMINF